LLLERLVALQTLLEQVEADVGPEGWLDWLLGMRNMLIHRGRRIIAVSMTRGRGGVVEDTILILPKSPELTEVDAWVRAVGYAATQLHVSRETFLRSLLTSVHAYLNAQPMRSVRCGASGARIQVCSNNRRLNGEPHRRLSGRLYLTAT
jgi:hypothetical protein